MAQACWYVAGLHFECAQCGRCCSGPAEGYIWVTAEEIAAIAGVLDLPIRDVRAQLVRREGRRTTIIEDPRTRDCIFLKTIEGQRRCQIYAVRPRQCRTWPFWAANLASPEAWCHAAQRCSGINRGRVYTHDEIERLKD
ncbi:MAG: YkgJ family cysteine cluster protein [Phycisphaerae bacterium]|nr:YkgJ family cysteine cluster protein [Phycisphaerae bacterium]